MQRSSSSDAPAAQAGNHESAAGSDSRTDSDSKSSTDVCGHLREILPSVQKAMRVAFDEAFPEVQETIRQAVKAAVSDELGEDRLVKHGSFGRRLYRSISHGPVRAFSFHGRRSTDETGVNSCPVRKSPSLGPRSPRSPFGPSDAAFEVETVTNALSRTNEERMNSSGLTPPPSPHTPRYRKDAASERQQQQVFKAPPLLTALKVKNKMCELGRKSFDSGPSSSSASEAAAAASPQAFGPRRLSAGAGVADCSAPKKIPTFLRLDVEADSENSFSKETLNLLQRLAPPNKEPAALDEAGEEKADSPGRAPIKIPTFLRLDVEADSDNTLPKESHKLQPFAPHSKEPAEVNETGTEQADTPGSAVAAPSCPDVDVLVCSYNDLAPIAKVIEAEEPAEPAHEGIGASLSASPSKRFRPAGSGLAASAASESAEAGRSPVRGVLQAVKGLLNLGRQTSTRPSLSVRQAQTIPMSPLHQSEISRAAYENAGRRTHEELTPTLLHRKRADDLDQENQKLESPGLHSHETARSFSKKRSKSKTFTEAGQPPPWAHQHRRKAVLLDSSTLAQLKEQGASQSWEWPFTDPLGMPRRCWDITGFTLLILQLLYIPFHSAFVSIEDLQDPFFSLTNQLLGVVDCFWLIDIVLNFTTGFVDSRHALQRNPRSIASRYARSWLVFDIVATIPSLINRVLFYIQENKHMNVYFWLTLMPVIRMPKIAQVGRRLRQLEVHLKSSLASTIITLVQLIMLPIAFSHITACALWAVGRCNLNSNKDSPSWIKGGLSVPYNPGALQAVSMYDRYTTAMYFAVTVMTTVGLGDISTEMSNERCLLVVIMLCTSIIVGVAINGVAMLVSKLGERSSATNEHLAKAANFMRSYSVPQELQRRVHAYLVQFFETKDRDETKTLLLGWLKKSEYLRVNLNLALTGNCLAEHDLLCHVPLDVLVGICDACAMVFHPPGEELESAGQEVKTFFYIRHGVVTLSAVMQKAKRTKKMNTNLRFPHKTTPEHTTELAEVVSENNPFQFEIDEAEYRRPPGDLVAGSFISDFRLFLGVSKASRTATCASFCELISCDIDHVQRLMRQNIPELFDALIIYCSINNDCPKALVSNLEDMEQHADNPLLFGEAALHHCASKNACACAAYLIEECGADLNLLTQENKTAAQLAAELKHKAVFELLILNGAIVSDEDVLPSDAYTVKGRKAVAKHTKNSVSNRELTSAIVPAPKSDLPKPQSRAHLREILESAGLKIEDSGSHETKPLDDLLHELRTCDSQLVIRAGKRLRRQVKLVRVRVMAIIEEQVRALVEMQTDAWMRNPQQKLGKLPCRRMLQHQSEDDTLKELLMDLGFTPQILDDNILATVGKATYSEIKTSMSYPGLETEYIVHETSLRIRKQGMPLCSDVGLPHGRAFKVESTLASLQSVNRLFFWPVLKHIQVEPDEDELKISEESLSSPRQEKKPYTISSMLRGMLWPESLAGGRAVHPVAHCDQVITAKQCSIRSDE
eukprot:TRINITY_DN2412_c0_g4_i1.p1 TRINITY_DN2412_c0_g4~~TRINITY_DN2412_c0_g4_i1.p1  ORF type:complete len:1495 (-),score=265.79 TRINITY_DN2412_c0_g4_i1:257-4741(-)